MGIGTVQTIFVCVPAGSTQAPCPTGMALSTIQAYIIDPSQADSIEAQNAPFDYAYAGAVWVMAFTFVVGLFLVSKSAGTILSIIRK
jgi:hypothetical protein